MWNNERHKLGLEVNALQIFFIKAITARVLGLDVLEAPHAEHSISSC